MSNTRYAKPGGGSDERFASDPLLNKGLKTGDVVRRVETLDEPRDIELAFFLQYISNLAGGLDKLASDLLASFPGRLGTPLMHQFGIKFGDRYGSDQVKAVRNESSFGCEDFLLRGENPSDDFAGFLTTDHRSTDDIKKSRLKSVGRPTSYPISAFLEKCALHFTKSVPSLLRNFCIDPAFAIDQLTSTSFLDLHGALIDYMDLWEQKRLKGLPITALGGKILEATNYAEDQRCLALVEGFARTGKTFIAKAWSEARPGKRRFVSLSEATSDKEFYREIAKAVGSASSFGFKSNELRERVNDILRSGHFTLVIDEAHFLWPQRNKREAVPLRIEWVRASLANYDVPVVMIATPQFTKAQQQIEKHTNWSSEQLVGRIAFCAKLPDRLEARDIESVARFHLPEADKVSLEFLVDYVIASKKHLASIDHGVKAARHQARKAGRERVTYDDVILGFRNTVSPSDTALAAAAEPAPAARGSARRNGFASRLQTASRTISTPIPEREKGRSLTVKSLLPARSCAPESLSSA